jgi:hypothetical protein
MTPEQLIAEVEALDKSATHGPWIAGELGTNDAGVIRDSYQDFIGASDGNRWQENTQLIARFRTLAPELAQHCKELQAAVDRLTAERDQAVARNAFLHNETGKALEIIAGRIELNPPISADEQSDIEAVARWVKAIGAEQVARLMKERDAARAELARLTTLRPIEEAPKDGTSMLCWCPGYGWRHLYWDHVWLLVGAPCDEYEPTQFLSLPVKP